MPARSKAKDEAVHINFRLNPRRPKERIILEFLRQHTENYDASRVIKQALYEMATGRSWINGQMVQAVSENDNMTQISGGNADRVLDDIVAGLDDWLTQ